MPNENDEPKGWLSGATNKVVVGLVSAIALSGMFWAGGVVKQITVDAADTHISEVMTNRLPVIADPIYLRRVVFDDYAKLQIKQANESQLRSIQSEIVRIEGELKYGTLSEGRRAQLEEQLQNYRNQRDDLQRKVNS